LALRSSASSGIIVKQYDLNKYCAACAIARYLKLDKGGKRLQKPKFQKDNRSAEFSVFYRALAHTWHGSCR